MGIVYLSATTHTVKNAKAHFGWRYHHHYQTGKTDRQGNHECSMRQACSERAGKIDPDAAPIYHRLSIILEKLTVEIVTANVISST